MMAVISCPRRCSRLITAAIFLSAGIIQLIAGLVFLRSDHVSLLSVPDFWTAISNIGVGCLIGLLASVWKHDRRSRTINTARRHLVRALYITSLMVNVTASVILILGEGNALLSVLEVEESDLGPELTLASEILAYAYAASVILPITCSVVSFVCLIFSCCPEPSSAERRLTKKKFKKKFRNPETYSWVYTPEISRSTKSLDRKSLFRSSCGGYSNRSSMTLSSSFSGFASGLESPVPKLLGYSDSSKIGTIRSIDDGKQPITSPQPTSPIDTDGSFEESGSTPPIVQLVPIHLGMRSSKRQLPVSAVPVRIPIAPERDWSNLSWTASPRQNVLADSGDASTKPKTLMHFRNSSCDSSGEDDASPKSSHDRELADDHHKSKRMMRKEHIKIQSKCSHLKRPDLTRLKLMESINECPVDYSDDDDSLDRISPTASSGYGSTLDHAINYSSSYSEATSVDEIHGCKERHSIVDLNQERTIQERLNAFREA